MSQFDPAAFLMAETSEVSKKRPPLPVGVYDAVLGEGKMVPWSSKKDPSKSGWKYEAPLTLQVPPDIQGSEGLPATVVLTYGVMLELTPNNTLDLAPGKNGGLRRFREALDMNREGDTFSFAKTFGRPVKAQITHELYEGEIQERIGALSRV